MKLLIVGASGQVGRSLVDQATRAGDQVVATYNSRPPVGTTVPVEHLDKTDAGQCKLVVEKHRPDVIIDTGALHNVDFCETHPEDARRVNVEGTRTLALAAARFGAKPVFVSTDFVFDGAKPGPYVETDPTGPLSVYAESKLEGEEAARSSAPGAIIVRPSVIYSWLDSRSRAASSSGKGLNFGTWLVEEVAHSRAVNIIDDQVASPTLAEDLAGAILALVACDAEGTFHAAGITAATRFRFSIDLVSRVGLDANLVRPIRTADLNQKARRPPNSSLRSDRLTQVSGYRMLDLSVALDRFARSLGEDPGAPGRGP